MTPAIIMLLVFTLICIPKAPSWANQLGTQLEVTLVPAASVAGMALAGYMFWKYRVNQPPDAKGKLGYDGPGEFYVGEFFGVSFVPNMDWYNTKQTTLPFSLSTTNIRTDPGPAGGLKVGYFLDSFPYLGFEGEGSIASNKQPRQTISISPPVNGSNSAVTRGQTMLIWTRPSIL